MPIVSGVKDILVSTILVSALIAFGICVWTRLAGRLWMRIPLLAGLLISLLPSAARRPSEAAWDGSLSLLVVLLAFALIVIFLRNNLLAYLLSAAFL